MKNFIMSNQLLTSSKNSEVFFARFVSLPDKYDFNSTAVVVESNCAANLTFDFCALSHVKYRFDSLWHELISVLVSSMRHSERCLFIMQSSKVNPLPRNQLRRSFEGAVSAKIFFFLQSQDETWNHFQQKCLVPSTTPDYLHHNLKRRPLRQNVSSVVYLLYQWAISMAFFIKVNINLVASTFQTIHVPWLLAYMNVDQYFHPL